MRMLLSYSPVIVYFLLDRNLDLDENCGKLLYVFNAMSLQVSLNVVRYHKRLLLLCNGRHFHTSIYKTFPRGAPKPDPSLKHQSTGDRQAYANVVE